MTPRAYVATFALAWLAGCQLISGADDLVFGDLSPGGGGVGGEGGSGGSGAAGGMGGSECAVAADCPGVETTCAYRVCEDGTCGMVNADAGTPCTEDDGSFCDGNGACVECLTENHCEAGFTCQDKACIPLSCTNRTLDPGEADVDCGGVCPLCDNGASCTSYEDCQSAFCDLGNAGGGGAGGSGGAGMGGAGGMGAGGTGGAGGAGGAGGTGGAGGGATTGQCAPCGGHADCAPAPDAYCDAGSCVGKEMVGAACSDEEACLSGHCADGFCCATACDGSCVSCAASQTNAQNGTCAAIKVGTDPGGECLVQPQASCGAAGQGCNGDNANPGCILHDSMTVCVPASCDSAANEETLASTCDGMGTCDAVVVQSCFPFICNVAETACRTQCGSDGDCATGAYCQSMQCLAKQAQGTACTAANQCLSGNCVDGVCCESACTATCRACSQAKTGAANGTCAFIPDNQDPDSECGLLTCNGAGACAL